MMVAVACLLSLTFGILFCGNAVRAIDNEIENKDLLPADTQLLSQQDENGVDIQIEKNDVQPADTELLTQQYDAVTQKDSQSIPLLLDVGVTDNEPVNTTVDNWQSTSEIRNQVDFELSTSAEEFLVTNEDILPEVLQDASKLPRDLDVQSVVAPADEESFEVQQTQQHIHEASEENIVIQTETARTDEHFDIDSSGVDMSSIWEGGLAFENLIAGVDQWINLLIDNLPNTVRKLFTNAPLDLSPARCLMVFLVSCAIVLMTFIPILHKAVSCVFSQQKNTDLSEQFFAAENAIIVSEQENEDLRKELDTLKLRIHEYEDRSALSTTETDDLTMERDRLQRLLSEQEDLITVLESTAKSQECELLKFANENTVLKNELQQTKDHVAEAQSELSKLQSSLQKSETSALEMQSQLQSMSEEISILQTSKDQDMCEELSQLREEQKLYQEAISLKDCEIMELKNCFHQLKMYEDQMLSVSENPEESADGDVTDEELRNTMQEKLNDMLDVAKVNAKLQAVEEECHSFQRALSIEVESRLKLEEHLKETKEEMSKIIESRQEAEQQVNAAKVKMDVLSSYFKDKERDLTRKLNEQQAREKANADQLVSTDVRTKEFEAMVHLYKEQVEDLQKEIQKIEADYRRQIAVQEKKAHENWLSARQSERDLKEQKAEAHLLKQRIVELQTKFDALSEELRISKETRSDLPAANESNPRPVNLHGDGSLPVWRGIPPLLLKPRPFFPPMIVGDRPPLRVPLRFHDLRHRAPVPLVSERRYPTEMRRSPPLFNARSSPLDSSPMDRYSPRDRDMSPPLIHSLPLAPLKDRDCLELERGSQSSPLREGDRGALNVFRPQPQLGAGTVVSKGAARSPFQPRTDRPPLPPGSLHWSSSPT